MPILMLAGLYGYENITEPICTQSRTGFIHNNSHCHVLWQSKLQTETALSTMEAEIVALASCCCELFPIIDLVDLIGESVGLSREGTVKMHVSTHEDNAGALVLVNT